MSSHGDPTQSKQVRIYSGDTAALVSQDYANPHVNRLNSSVVLLYNIYGLI